MALRRCEGPRGGMLLALSLDSVCSNPSALHKQIHDSSRFRRPTLFVSLGFSAVDPGEAGDLPHAEPGPGRWTLGSECAQRPSFRSSQRYMASKVLGHLLLPRFSPAALIPCGQDLPLGVGREAVQEQIAVGGIDFFFFFSPVRKRESRERSGMLVQEPFACSPRVGGDAACPRCRGFRFPAAAPEQLRAEKAPAPEPFDELAAPLGRSAPFAC